MESYTSGTQDDDNSHAVPNNTDECPIWDRLAHGDPDAFEFVGTLALIEHHARGFSERFRALALESPADARAAAVRVLGSGPVLRAPGRLTGRCCARGSGPGAAAPCGCARCAAASPVSTDPSPAP